MENKQTALQNVLKDPMDREAWRVLGDICDWYVYSEVEMKLDGRHLSDASLSTKEANRRTMIDIENNLGIILKMNEERIIFSPYKCSQKTWKEVALEFHELNLTQDRPAAESYLINLVGKE